MIYSAESSFYESLFKAEWNFGSLFKDTLGLIKNDVYGQEIFSNKRIYEQRDFEEESNFMYTLPVRNSKICWKLIDQCVQHVKVKLMTFGSLSQILKMK